MNFIGKPEAKREALVGVIKSESKFTLVWHDKTARVDFYKGTWTVTEEGKTVFALNDSGTVLEAESTLLGAFITERLRKYSAQCVEAIRELPAQVILDTLAVRFHPFADLTTVDVIRFGRD